MFGKYRLGYAVLFGVAFVASVLAMVLADVEIKSVLDLSKVWKGAHLWALPLLIWLGITAVRMAMRRTDRPTLTLFRMVRRHRYWLMRGCLLLILIPPVTAAFSALKGSIPATVPFYLDPYLVDAEHAVFGTDPW